MGSTNKLWVQIKCEQWWFRLIFVPKTSLAHLWFSCICLQIIFMGQYWDKFSGKRLLSILRAATKQLLTLQVQCKWMNIICILIRYWLRTCKIRIAYSRQDCMQAHSRANPAPIQRWCNNHNFIIIQYTFGYRSLCFWVNPRIWTIFIWKTPNIPMHLQQVPAI